MIRAGDKAPEFELVSDTGETVRLEDFRGKRVIVSSTQRRTRLGARSRHARSAISVRRSTTPASR